MNRSKIASWVIEPVDSAIKRKLDALAESDDIAAIAVMPDVHVAGDFCNGVAIASRTRIYPQAVGGDIGCGYLFANIDTQANPLQYRHQCKTAWHCIADSVPIMRGKALRSSADETKRIFESELGHPRLEKLKHRVGMLQLGSLGRGNHFVEIQIDDQDELSILIHSGARSMGQHVLAHHLRAAEFDSCSRLTFLDANSDHGRRYLDDMNWAREYAKASRMSMLQAVADRLGAELSWRVDLDSAIDRDHNHVRNETFESHLPDRKSRGSELLFVHRKGVQRVMASENAVIPGSMGTPTYLVQGREIAASLNSCSHGAGRAISRGKAAHSISEKSFLQATDQIYFDRNRASALLDEAPAAYKDIHKVMKAQRKLVRIVGKRFPLINFKGSRK
jgi:tRNA-splicing ligase RtcB